MIEVFDGLGLWDQVAPTLRGSGQRRAAVAYVGVGARGYLGLRRNDVLVFDGDPKTVALGLINIKEVRSMLAAGVKLYSRPGLHSKMLVVEAKTPAALVGSPNASESSANRKSETAVVFDDPIAVQSVRDAVAGLTVGLKPIGKQWVDAMAKVAPRRRSADSTFRRVVSLEAPLAKTTKPMWFWNFVWTEERYYPAQVNRAVADAQAARGVSVDPFALRGRDSNVYNEVSVGDSVVLIPWPLNANAPRRNGRVMEPALVIDKIDRPTGKGGDLLLAWRHNASSVRYDELEKALARARLAVPQDRVTRNERRVVFDLFAGVS